MAVNRKTRRRDIRPFRALYRDHYGFVWSTVRRMGVRPDAIDDAVQDAFLIAFRRWDDLPEERSRAWLYGIARRVSSNARKVERRRVRKHDALRHHHAQRSEGVGKVEASVVLERFVQTLDPADRELFALGVVEGLTGRELSAALGAPASTLHGRLQSLRRRFRAEAGERADVTAGRARAARPRASAAAWAVLLPKLGVGAGVGGWAVPVAASIAAAGLVGTLAAVSPPARAPKVLADASAVLAPGPPLKDTAPAAPEPSAAMRSQAPPPSAEVFDSARRQRPPRKPDALAAEAALVKQIQSSARAGDWAAALRLIARHGRQHPRGALSDVVVALEVAALCEQGRTAEADARRAALLQARPSTPVAARLSQGCRAKKVDAVVVQTPRRGHGGS